MTKVFTVLGSVLSEAVRQAGHTVVEVAKWAGHSPQVCLGIYAHLFDTVGDRIDPDLAIRAARYGRHADDQRAAG